MEAEDFEGVQKDVEDTKESIDAPYSLPEDEVEKIEREIEEYNNSDEVLSNPNTKMELAMKSVPLLSPEEEIELARKVKEGDKQAYDRMFQANMRLVYFVVGKFKNYDEHDDLVQEGFIGLMKAIDKFNPEMGYKFSTYAFWWIRQSIGRYLDDKTTIIRVPVHMSEKFRKVKKRVNEFSNENGREPNDDEMYFFFEENGVPDYARDIYYKVNSNLSLNQAIGFDDTESELIDFVKDDGFDVESLAEKSVLKDEFWGVISQILTEKEIWVLKKRVLEEKTLEECGQELNLTRERVRQIEGKAFRKVRFSYKARPLRAYAMKVM